MDRTGAQIRGLPWTDFEKIPLIFKHIYDIILACNPIADATVRGVVTGINCYEQCCEYWFNNQLLEIEEKIKGEENGRKN